MASFYENPNEIKRQEAPTDLEGTKSFFGLYSGLAMFGFVMTIISIIADVIASIAVSAHSGNGFYLLYILLELPLIISAVILWKLSKYASWAKEEHEDLEKRLKQIESRLK
jgi:amino acid permease